MKYINKLILILILIDIILTNNCAIDSIYYSSNKPILVYKGKNNNTEFEFTVLSKNLSRNFRVSKSLLLYTNKNTEDEWYITKSKEKFDYSKILPILKLCRTLHNDNITTISYQPSSKLSLRYRTNIIPKRLKALNK